MIRGTTPTLVFNLPFNTKIIKSLYITIRDYNLNNSTILEKTLENCEVTETSVSVTLTQEETLKFSNGSKIDVQLRLITNDNVALASQIFTTSIDKILKDGVIE